jgi:hypothetical protein
MANAPGTLVPLAARVSGLPSLGVLFSSNSNHVALVNVGSQTTSPTLAIGGVTSTGLMSYVDPVRFTFVDPSDPNIPGVTDFVSIRGDLVPITQTASLSAFGVNGALLHTLTLPDSAGQTWAISLPGIHEVVLSGVSTGLPFGSGTGIALDDLTFNPVVPVPEPATLPAGALLAVLALR